MKKSISLLGCTGSIGTQCLDVCENLGLGVTALVAGSNVRLLAEQARKWRPALAVVADEKQYSALKRELADMSIPLAAGNAAVCEAAALSGSDTVVNAVVGIAGLRPTLAAIDAGKSIALANKETLVAGGALVTAKAREKGVCLLPIDSEHSAMLQCMPPERRGEVSGVILTASGGPFFGKSRGELETVTLKDTLQHPIWSMGKKISVDSATLMNKGLEFIEAMWLFDLDPDQIRVVVHRQSVVHSAVEYADGAVIAQMGVPDMHSAIQYSLTYPAHLPLKGKHLSLEDYGSLTFERPDGETFRCLEVCIRAARKGGLAPCVANGANEAAVDLFLQGKLSFLDIGELVAQALDLVDYPKGGTLEDIEKADRLAREFVYGAAG